MSAGDNALREALMGKYSHTKITYCPAQHIFLGSVPSIQALVVFPLVKYTAVH